MPLEWISQILEWVDSLPFPLNIIVRLIVFGGASAYVLWRAVKTVPQDQRALKLRLGKIIRHKKGPNAGQAKEFVPGRIYLLIPEVDKFEMVKVLDRTVEFPEKPIDVANYRQLKVEGNANYGALNIEYIRFRVEDVEPWLRGATQKVLRECAQQEWRGWNSPAYQARVAHRFAQRIDKVVDYVGVELRELHVTNFAETAEMALARSISEASHGVEVLPPYDEDFPQVVDVRVSTGTHIDVVDQQPVSWELSQSHGVQADAFKAPKPRRKLFRRNRGPKFGETGERL